MVQLNQGDVRRYVGVASTVIGLVCYALSSSFNRLYGEWSSFKICAYMVSTSIICLAILFPKAWQRWGIFAYRAHMTFLVMTSTTVYSFYLDRKMNTKPDAYGPISSAAFATASLCMSKQVECGFVDLLYFFCGLLITQLMQITPSLGFVGIGFSYFAVILRFYLDDPAPPNRIQSQPPSQVVIDIVPLLQSSALDASPQEEEGIDMVPLLQSSALDASPQEEEEGSNQNQVDLVNFFHEALPGAALQRQRELAWLEEVRRIIPVEYPENREEIRMASLRYFVDALRSYIRMSPVRYFVDTLRSYLGAPAPPNRSQSQPPRTLIFTASSPQSSALNARPQEGGRNQNQAPITSSGVFYSDPNGGFFSDTVRYRSRTSRANSTE